MAAKIKKGDKVVVLAGKDKGKSGEVTKVLPTSGRLIVQGVNMVKKHQKQTQTLQAGIRSFEASIAVSNVAYADPTDGKATKIGFKTLDDGRKVRFAKRSGEVIGDV
ncbi:MAG: rplX [Hyphomonadaceae bacterium]|nr:MAG: rplX [Hyphomonadaceae bacterium]